MSQPEYLADNPYASFGTVAADAPADARLTFIRKTYMHLAAAVYALVLLEYIFFTTLPLEQIVGGMVASRWSWLIVLGGFMVVSWIANTWARSDTSVGMQYAGLFLYVLAQAIILCPLLYFASDMTFQAGGVQANPIAVAAVLTLALFGVLTATVFITRTDFSFLGPILGIAGIVFMGLILLSIFGLMNAGVLICSGIVVLACGYILYDTSNVLHHFRTDQHVAASLALFASVALLFWYILRIVMAFSRD